MSPQEAQLGRLRSLLKSWSHTTQKKNALWGKTAGFCVNDGLKPSILQKLSSWMTQIGCLQRKELAIISEINAVEEKHQRMRLEKKLRRAAPSREKEAIQFDPEPRPKDRFWMWLLLFALLFSDHKKAQAPQNG